MQLHLDINVSNYAYSVTHYNTLREWVQVQSVLEQAKQAAIVSGDAALYYQKGCYAALRENGNIGRRKTSRKLKT